MAAGVSFSWTWLWALLRDSGENAPKVAALVMGALTDFRNGGEKLAEAGKLLGMSLGVPPKPGPIALNADETEAQEKCLAFLEQHSGPHALAFGDGLRDFLKNNPWVLKLLAISLQGLFPAA